MRHQRVWTEEELEYLRAHYLDESCESLAGRFGCSGPTVAGKIRAMGLKKVRSNQRYDWTQEQLDYIREHFPREAAVDIADVIGVSSELVRKKAVEMGLRKSPDYDVKKYYHRYIRDYKNNEHKVFVA